MSLIAVSPETEILSRVIAPDNPAFTADAARSILKLGFSDSDRDQMNTLAAKARAGSLSKDDETQLQAYRFVGSLLDLLHSKARLSLKKYGR